MLRIPPNTKNKETLIESGYVLHMSEESDANYRDDLLRCSGGMENRRIRQWG